MARREKKLLCGEEMTKRDDRAEKGAKRNMVPNISCLGILKKMLTFTNRSLFCFSDSPISCISVASSIFSECKMYPINFSVVGENPYSYWDWVTNLMCI